MKLNQLVPKQKKVARKRRGQGNAAGQGTYGGRGMNGQNARAGGGVRKGFEGGQTPLIRRMPKRRGFNNPNRIETQVVDVAALDEHFKDGDTVDLAALVETGLAKKTSKKVKILASGEIKTKVTVDGVNLSKTAQAAIEKAGGSVVAVKKVEEAKEDTKKTPKKEDKKTTKSTK